MPGRETLIVNALPTLLSLLIQACVFLGLAEFLLRRRGLSLRRAGLQRPTRRQVATGLTLGTILFVAANSIAAGMDYSLKHLLSHHAYEVATSRQWTERVFEGFASPWQKLTFVLVGAVVAPLCEEAFFRGYLYTALRARSGLLVGTVGSASIFALLHIGSLTSVCVIFFMGMALATAYERTNSLWTSILMHGVNNMMSFIVLWTGAQ